MNPFDKEAYYYDLFHKDRNYKKEAEKIKKEFPGAKTILEIGCGTGNLSVELEKCGFKVMGIDSSSEMLKRYKGSMASLKRIEDLTVDKKYDLIIAPYDVLNYITPEEFSLFKRKANQIAPLTWIQLWPLEGILPFTHKKVGNCHRIRLGFGFNNKAYLWYIFWGKGIVVSHHKLYLHI